MNKRNTLLRDGFTDLYRGNKYWFLGSTIFFLLAASIYLIFTPITYKVATRIVVKSNQNPKEIIKDVKSKALLQKVISQLPLQVVYFQKKNSKESEVSKDKVPVKFVMSENTPVNSSAELKIFIVNNQQYKILKDKVFMYFLFDEPVNFYSFAKFKIVKTPWFKPNGQPSVIRVYSNEYLLKEYSKNMDAKFVGVDHKSIEISLTGNSLKKGQIFLDKLVKVYNGSGGIANISNAAVEINPGSLERAGNELAVLRAKAEQLKNRQAMLVNGKKTGNPDKTSAGKGNTQLLNVLNAVEPYAKSSVDQFVLIPYGDEITDHQLKKLISEFNKTQTDKQHALQTSPIDNSKINSFNRQLSATKQALLARININKDELNGHQRTAAGKNVAMPAITGINDSISKINTLLNAKLLQYNSLLQSRRKTMEAAPAKPQQPVIEKSSEHVVSYPKIGYVYLFALLIGLALPLIIPYFKLRVNVN